MKRRSLFLPLPGLAAAALLATAVRAAPCAIRATRVGDAPIITPGMLPGDDGASIDGPSLIRVPAWVSHPLGRYYLYFAHHAGKYIRLACANRLEGPWKILPGGVQPLAAQRAVAGHIASPDAVVDAAERKIYLFYHGKKPSGGGQTTGVSVSDDGLHFRPLNRAVGPAYLRVFTHGGRWFALNQSGVLRSCPALGEPFTPVARIVGPDIAASVAPSGPHATGGPDRYSIRHIGVDADGDRLYVYFSCVGHRPERILATCVDMIGAPETWRARGVCEVLRPERPWEGADRALVPSRGGISEAPVDQVRDPAVFRDGSRAWLLYTVAGEHGIALARLRYGDAP